MSVDHDQAVQERRVWMGGIRVATFSYSVVQRVDSNLVARRVVTNKSVVRYRDSVVEVRRDLDDAL